MRRVGTSPLLLGALLALLGTAPADAQVDESGAAEDSGGPVEELVVYGDRPGDQKRPDPVYEEIMRQQMMDEVRRMRLEEEQDWRNSNLNYRSSDESRIVWGYDPKTERDMRDEFDREGIEGDTVKPATLFRAQF